MIIDFHTHVFPEKIAYKAINALKASSGYDNRSDGTTVGLVKSMDVAGIDISVNMPILSKPDGFEKTLLHLKEETAREKRIVSFAPIHPRCDDIENKIRIIVGEGYKGIKLHPFFQNEPLDSDATMRVVSLASAAGLYTMIHPGKDASFPNVNAASPDKIVRLLEQVKPKNVILAHMGAMEYWDEVYECIAGRDVYIDTSFSMDVMGRERFLRIVKKHGADRVLFGTDSPWRDQKSYVELLKRETGLSDEEKRKIFYENGAKILGL